MINSELNSTIKGEEKDLVPVEGQVIQVETNSLNQANVWEDFVSLWMRSKEVDNINQFFKGDIADKVGCKYGDSGLTKFANEVKEPYQTIVAYRRVARAFKSEMRALDMCWTHYLLASQTDEYNKATGNFGSDNRVKWLEKAHDNNWSVGQLAVEIKKEKALIKESAFTYYLSYIEKIGNIVLHMDKTQLSKNQKDKLVEKLYDVSESFDDYLNEPINLKEIETIKEMPTLIKYNSLEEAQVALKARKQKKGSLMIRHCDNGQYDLVTEEILAKENKKEYGI